MKTAIIVLNYNGLENTLQCLESLRRAKKTSAETEIIVVDNNSEDGSQEALSNLKDIRLIINNQNLGYSGGNNVGIKKALERGARQVLVLNNDTTVEEKFLPPLINALEKVDIVSPKIYFYPGFEFHKKRYSRKDLGNVIWYAGAHIDFDNILGIHEGVDQVDRGQFERRKQINFATGAAMMIKRGVFERIGLFDEKYFLYLEDMDFCLRAKKANFKIAFEPKSIVWHKNADSLGSGSPTQDYYFTRNRLLFAFKYAKLRTKIAVLKETVSKSTDPIKRKALLDFLMLKFKKTEII